MTTSTEAVGARLRRLRTERGLSQRDLSAPGVSYAYISRIEGGSRTPSVKALRLLAGKLGVSPEYLETGTDLTPTEERELRLRRAELQVRLGEDTDEASAALRDLEREADAAGDATAALRAKVALARVAHLEGERATVIRVLEPVVSDQQPSSLDYWDLYAMLVRAYAASGRLDDAVTTVRSCLEEVERDAPHDDISWTRVAIMLSAVLADAGEAAEARESAATALQRGGGAGDPLARVRVQQSYAEIAAGAHRPRAALERLRRAATLLEETEETHELARAHLLWAESFTAEGSPERAEQHLGLAERLLGAYPSREDLAKLRIEQSRAATAKGDPQAGIELAAAALDLVAGSDREVPASAQWALGEAQLAAGRRQDGIRSLHAALDLFEMQGDWYRSAAVSRMLGRVLREAGRGADALNVLERAVQFATLVEGAGSQERAAPRSELDSF